MVEMIIKYLKLKETKTEPEETTWRQETDDNSIILRFRDIVTYHYQM